MDLFAAPEAYPRYVPSCGRSFPPPFTGEVDRKSEANARRKGDRVWRPSPFRLAALGTSPASGGGKLHVILTDQKRNGRKAVRPSRPSVHRRNKETCLS